MANPLLEKLLKQKEHLEARMKTLKAESLKKERKDDTRCKILAGAYILRKHEKADTLEAFFEEMDAFLSKPQDKILFKLWFKSVSFGNEAQKKSGDETND